MATVDPASEEAQRNAEDAVGIAAIALEIGLFSIIAERLANIDDLSFAELYAVMPADIQRIQSELSKGEKRLQSVTQRVMDDMTRGNDDWAAKYYQARGVEQVSAFNHSMMQQTIQASTEGIKRKVTALCRSTVVGVGNSEFVPVEEAYRRIVSSAATAMTSGKLSGDDAIARAIGMLSRDGLRVRYESGITRNLHTAVRTNVMDAYRSTMSSLREMQGREFGADGVEVTAHALCAPDHQPFQGMQYSNAEWRDIQFQPARPLVVGANCGHTVFPVILGISSRAYSSREIAELNALSNEEVEFEGLSGDVMTMSRYDASQYQRKVETTIRKHREAAYLTEKAGQDASKLHRGIESYERRYAKLSRQMGLTARFENTSIHVAK